MDSNLFLGGLASAAGILAFFGGIALIIWASSSGEAAKRRAEAEKLQLDHAERLKAIELGMPPPDAEVARARADVSRARAAAVVAWLVPWGAIGAAVGTTAIVLDRYQLEEGLRTAMVCTAWGVAGLVSVVAVSLALDVMRRAGKPPPRKPDPRDVLPREQPAPGAGGQPAFDLELRDKHS